MCKRGNNMPTHKLTLIGEKNYKKLYLTSLYHSAMHLLSTFIATALTF